MESSFLYFQGIFGYDNKPIQIFPSYIQGDTPEEEGFDNQETEPDNITLRTHMQKMRLQKEAKKRTSGADKAYACSYPGCFYSYAQKKNLRRHEVSVHGRIPKRTGRWHAEMRKPSEPPGPGPTGPSGSSGPWSDQIL